MLGLFRNAKPKSANKSASDEALHTGLPYLDYLKLMHEAVRPRNYLEVGVRTGKSFRLAKCPAVGVDPQFIVKPIDDPLGIGGRPETHMFQCTSDDFFANTPIETFLKPDIDCAFLDGMHLFEFLLRDFINTERRAHAGTIVILHDCHPTRPGMALRERGDITGWAGDVWKLLPILKEHRPELRIKVLDCPPTGLAFVLGLDPTSTVLSERYEAIVAKYEPLTLEDYGLDRLRAEFPALASRERATPAAISELLERKPASGKLAGAA